MKIDSLFNVFRDYLSLRPEEKVREWFDRFDWNRSQRNLTANHLSAERHLDNLVAHSGKGERSLVEAFVEAKDELHWFQSYSADDFGAHFADNYAHVEMIGTRGHYVSDQIAGGFVLFGPELEYPDHWHISEELYFPLTGGALWSRDGGAFTTRKSGEFVFHESNMPHAMTMQENPLLALWVWRGNVLVQKSDYRKN